MKREAEIVERLQSDAVLLLISDDQPLAGIVQSGSSWEVLVCVGFRHQQPPFEDMVDAVLELYGELSSIGFRSHLRAIGMPVDSVIPTPDHARIVQRGATAALLLDETRKVLHAEFQSDQLDDEVLELFYEYFADQPTRTVIEDRWANEAKTIRQRRA